MFKSIKKKSVRKKIRNFIWPERGWKRASKYILLRLNRLKGTHKEIACGVACGVAISFTPFVGFHFVLAAITAWFVRGNIFASAIGTAVGNPWTFPFIWVSVLYTGRAILGGKYDEAGRVKFIGVFQEASHALMTFDFHLFISDVWPIIWPMMVGAVPFYIVSWFVSYHLVKKALDGIKIGGKSKQGK